MPVWDEFLTENDRAAFGASGFGAYLGPGARPCLLVIDVSYAFTGDKDEPLLDSIAKWSHSCGPTAWRAIPYIQQLLAGARAKNLPVIYSTGLDARPDGFGRGLWRNSRISDAVPPLGYGPQEIVREIAPQERDVVIRKTAPSVFHGTPLAAYLISLKVDSLIVVGTTTSGCVRATVVDAFSHNFRVAVAEEGCFDRGEASHAMSLFDLDAKYADVMPTAQVLDYFETLDDDLFAGQIAPAAPTAFPDA
jgi:maleamate amidohydrolase|nr:hydrolase [Aeromicrobium sp.]